MEEEPKQPQPQHQSQPQPQPIPTSPTYPTTSPLSPLKSPLRHSPLTEPTLLTHPLFQHDRDPILSLLSNCVRSLTAETPNVELLKTQSNRWLGLLIQIIFNNIELPALKEQFQKFGLSFDTICGKFIGHDEIYFRCLDCDRFKDTTSSIYALLCSQCFENSNHEGHRVLMVKKDSNCSATCDCGDHTAFDPTGFCRDHQPKEFCVKETLSKFPQSFLQKCILVLKNTFYGVISLFEIAYAAQQDRNKETLMALAQLTLQGTLVFCGLCYGEVNEAFLIVFGELFKSNFLENYNGVWHDCEDIAAQKGVKTVDPANPHACTCTIAANLLRIGNIADQEIQVKLHQILVECAKEANFKTFLIKEFTKYIHFLYTETYSNDDFDDHSNSKLLSMKAQLYGSEDLCMETLKSGYFDNLVNVLKKTVHNASHANHDVYHIASDIRSALIYFLNGKNKASSELVKETPLLSQIMEIIANFQVKFFYEGQFHIGLFDHQVNYNSINRGLMIEKVISQVLEQGIRIISGYPHEEKVQLLQKLASEWLTSFQTAKAIRDQELEKGIVSFHPALERVFTSMVRVFGDELTEEGVARFFKEALPGVEDVANLAGKVAEGALRSLGMVRFVHLVHNFTSGKIWHVYYFASNLFFEMDILTIQLMTSVLEPERLFEMFVKNFFAYDESLQKFFENPQSLSKDDERLKQKVMVLEDFLHFLIYIMNDETCRLNSKVCKDIHTATEETELSVKCHGVIEKVLINLLLGHYWIDVPQLKETMKNVLIQHSDVDDILHKVAVFDEKSKKVRIKDEYQNELDPYIFYRTPAIQSDIVQNVASKAKKNKTTDMVSGKYYNNLPCYLTAIQNKIFQSSLPKYLTKFLYEFQEHTVQLVRPVLKLILLNLQVINEAMKENRGDALKQNAKENYLTQAFTDRLSQLAQQSDLQDCEACIGKIQKLIEIISYKLHDVKNLNAETKDNTTHEDQAAQKKKLAHQRMQQLKDEFMKKQKLFITKVQSQASEHSAGLKFKEETDEIVENEENGITCQYCLDKIDREQESYGTPVYVSFTNNLYDVEEAANTGAAKKQERPERLEGNWWPIVSSCMHHYHRRCFQSHYKSSRKAPDTMGKLFTSSFETYCSLCNTLCNAFVLEGGPREIKRPNQEGNEGLLVLDVPDEDEVEAENGENADKPQEPQEPEGEPLLFAEIIEGLVKNLKDKLRVQPTEEIEEEAPVEAQEIFKRGYNYFLETFHLSDKAANLEKTCLVYKGFIKEYLYHLKKKGLQANKNPSLLAKVFSNPTFSNNEQFIEKKIAILANIRPDALLNDACLDILVKSSAESDDITEPEFVSEHLKILKEYIALKIIQLILYCKESNVSLKEAYSLYKEDQELKEDVLDALLFPVQKFAMATCLARTILIGDDKPNEKLLETLLKRNDDIEEYLDKLIKLTGLGESFDKVIEESLEELGGKSADIVESLTQMLSHDTAGMTLAEPQSVKLAPKVIRLPKTYQEFINIYFKKKCGQCNQYSPHMATYICLICGEVMCLAYCASIPQKKGNLNIHSKQCHLGSSMFVEIQRLSKVIVASAKNSMFPGKDIYTDKLGQAIHNLIGDPRSLLYSVDFDKFTVSDDFVKNAKHMLRQGGLQQEVYKVTKASGFYYAEGNL